MPRIETVTRTLYGFDELDDRAKEKARDWWREGGLDYDWWDATYEDAAQCAAILGIDITARGEKQRTPTICFSGFSSQGDGACFEGTWSWKACAQAMRDYAPQDKALHAIADTLTALPNGEGWRASIKHRGRYSHSGCMDIDVEFDDDWYRSIDAGQADPQDLPQADFSAGEASVIQAMRDFADWIYGQLEKEYDYLMSDEHVDESIQINGYGFTEKGARA